MGVVDVYPSATPARPGLYRLFRGRGRIDTPVSLEAQKNQEGRKGGRQEKKKETKMFFRSCFPPFLPSLGHFVMASYGTNAALAAMVAGARSGPAASSARSARLEGVAIRLRTVTARS